MISASIRSTAEGLELLEQIKSSEDNGVLTPDDANRIRKSLLDGITSLFETQVRISTTSDNETVSNQKLLSATEQPRLLTAPSDSEETE